MASDAPPRRRLPELQPAGGVEGGQSAAAPPRLRTIGARGRREGLRGRGGTGDDGASGAGWPRGEREEPRGGYDSSRGYSPAALQPLPRSSWLTAPGLGYAQVLRAGSRGPRPRFFVARLPPPPSPRRRRLALIPAGRAAGRRRGPPPLQRASARPHRACPPPRPASLRGRATRPVSGARGHVFAAPRRRRPPAATPKDSDWNPLDSDGNPHESPGAPMPRASRPVSV